MVDSDVLRGIRDRGRKGDDRRLAYFDGATTVRGRDIDGCDHALGTPGCALDDRSRWERETRLRAAYHRRVADGVPSGVAARGVRARVPRMVGRTRHERFRLTAADWVAVETEADLRVRCSWL